MRAKTHGHCDFAGVANAGQHHNLGCRTGFANAPERLQSIRTGHDHVEQDDIGLVTLHFLKRLFAV